jgi:pyruvate dehydrogenase E1 component
MNDNEGRTGTLLRLVTRGVEQKDMLHYLKKQARFKVGLEGSLARSEFPVSGAANEETIETQAETEIFSKIREEVLQGAYFLIDYRGYAGYEPGDNVINIFAMGAMVTEAIKASESLLAMGIYANVIAVTSSDLLIGIQGYETDYAYLKQGLGVNSNLYLRKAENSSAGELMTIAGKRIPVVSIADGEEGLLDNIGSIIGVRQEALAVRKHSKCGRPSEIYAYHGIDSESVIEACGKVLAETALEKIVVSASALSDVQQSAGSSAHWTELWKSRKTSHNH